MDQDIRTFLRGFSRDELINRGILLPGFHPYELKADSVDRLIQLMKEQNITRLEARDRTWFLTSDGKFKNPGSREQIKEGSVCDLYNPGNVFTGQNRYINPHYPRSGNAWR